MSIWFNLSPGSSKKSLIGYMDTMPGRRTICHLAACETSPSLGHTDHEGSSFCALQGMCDFVWISRPRTGSSLDSPLVVGCRGFPISLSKLHWTEWMPGFPSLSCTKMHQIPSSNVDRAGVRMGEIVCAYMCMNPPHIISHRIHVWYIYVYMLTFGVYWWDPCYHI